MNWKKKIAVVNESVCLGCGVCHRACKFEALSMKRRKQKVVYPENFIEKELTMALERGKLQNYIFDKLDNPTYDFLAKLIAVVLDLPFVKQILLQKELKSKFVDFALKKAGMK